MFRQESKKETLDPKKNTSLILIPPFALLDALYKTYGSDTGSWQWHQKLDDLEFTHLLAEANILTPKDMDPELDFIARCAICIFSADQYHEDERKKNFVPRLKMLLRLLNKHQDMHAINFAPFISAGLLTAADIETIKQPQADSEAFKQILQAIKNRNQAMLDICYRSSKLIQS